MYKNAGPLTSKGPLKTIDHKFKMRSVIMLIWFSSVTVSCTRVGAERLRFDEIWDLVICIWQNKGGMREMRYY